MADASPAVRIDPAVRIPDVSDATWVVGALIFDQAGRAFAQRRAHDRRLFPGCWDVVGGHVDPGEDVVTALAREVREETGWTLEVILAEVGRYEWSADGIDRREVDYIVTVAGDLSHPELEIGKHSEFAWLTPAELPRLLESRGEGDRFIYDLFVKAFALMSPASGEDPPPEIP